MLLFNFHIPKSVENYTYFPFSLGPRNCIGQNFAQIEGVILIAKFIQNFDFRLDPTQKFHTADLGTLKPFDGTKCFISLREDQALI
jgi:cholesterol 24(S)-hydroxylase